ncbi:hypothetical protein DMC47_04220 [Nostoc sp. 3335mG]|nr:hypothetical protein DMC47_04220 [Nostoc sp. 3335mG]
MIIALAARVSSRRTLGAIFDLVRGKRVRGWNKLCLIAADNSRYYERWIDIAEPLLIQARLARAPTKERSACPASPLVGLVLGGGQAPEAAACTAASLREAFGDAADIWVMGQNVPGCLTIASSISPAKALDRICQGSGAATWLIPMHAGDLLSPFAGQVIAQAVRNDPVEEVIYWDSDELIEGRRSSPWLKATWDPLLYLARDGLSRSCAVRMCAAIAVSSVSNGTTSDMDFNSQFIAGLIMRMVARNGAPDPVHVPLIMTHYSGATKGSALNSAGISAPQVDLWADLVARYWSEPVVPIEGSAASPFRRVAPPFPQVWPSVSIIIPTRDKVELLRACLDGLAKLNYPGSYEIVVVDNGTTQREALELMRDRQAEGSIHVIRDDGPFNFAALNNMAVARSSSEVICLLNNDVEALDGGWLATMVRHAARPDIGAVGALLLYPDGSVQHAGVAIGTGGAAGHLARGVRPDNPAHFAWHGVTRTVSAVTAACMVVRREVYLSVGGLDGQSFAVAFNDVDFCMRLQQRGLRNVFVAEARLIHHESISRGKDHAPSNIARFSGELARFRGRWGSQDYRDPHYSPLFSRSAEPCVLNF